MQRFGPAAAQYICRVGHRKGEPKLLPGQVGSADRSSPEHLLLINYYYCCYYYTYYYSYSYHDYDFEYDYDYVCPAGTSPFSGPWVPLPRRT